MTLKNKKIAEIYLSDFGDNKWILWCSQYGVQTFDSLNMLLRVIESVHSKTNK